MLGMVFPLLSMRREIIKVWLHDFFNVVKRIGNGTLECGSSVLKAKGYLPIGEGSPWEYKCRLVLIGRKCLNLIIARKAIHE